MTPSLPPEDVLAHDTGPLLDIQGLQTYFRTGEGVVKAVDGLDLALHRGQTLGVIAESGCGKSVTARSILGLIAPPRTIPVQCPLHIARAVCYYGRTGQGKASRDKA